MISNDDLSKMLSHWLFARESGKQYLGSSYAAPGAATPELHQLLKNLPAFVGKAVAIQSRGSTFVVVLADGTVVAPKEDR